MKTKLIGIIICMLLVGTVLPVTGTLIIDTTTSSNTSGNTLYVGGSGEGNYTKIQDAINDSVDGDTVFVYNGTYYENLTIDKEITLLGEDREKTIIDGLKEFFTIVKISADSVTISGFTIQNCNDTNYLGMGIKIIEGDYISINNNIISTSDKPYGKSDGIYHFTTISKYISITNNIFINNSFGVIVQHAPFVNISDNVFKENDAGIYCTDGSNNAIITGNLIDGCLGDGILIESKYCIISKNTISNQKQWAVVRSIAGILIADTDNQIIDNNFINNKRNAICLTLPWGNKWDGNYWDNWIGFKYPQLDFLPYWGRYLFWFIIDWNPAQEPYDI